MPFLLIFDCLYSSLYHIVYLIERSHKKATEVTSLNTLIDDFIDSIQLLMLFFNLPRIFMGRICTGYTMM